MSFVFINVSSLFHHRSPSSHYFSLPFSFTQTVAAGPRLVSGQGLESPDSRGETMRIHRENMAKLQGMSQSAILEEQKKLLSQLGRRSCCPEPQLKIIIIVIIILRINHYIIYIKCRKMFKVSITISKNPK